MRHRSMRIFVNDDRHVMAKHSAIYPTQEELEGVQNMVSHTERALKAVSDWLDEQEKGNAKVNALESDEDGEKETEPKSMEQPSRSLRGVMRVGLVAKGILLKGDLDLELVLLCKDKPTITLLKKVSENLAVQLKLITDEKYDVKPCVRDATIVIKNSKEPPLTLTLNLTSPLVREEAEKQAAGETLSVNDPPDVLDRQKCLTALASLRHAKWFQARANGLRSCVIVIRILRDLCARVPTWAPLRGWPLELLCEKAIGTGNRPMGAGEALRRVLECLASGILMADGSGICDPCEKEPTDAISHMDRQQREDITQSAQHALRLSAFGQLHKVLGMDPLPSKVPRKPRSETPIDYTVQIPPSTTYMPPMKRPIEDEEATDEKNPNKKKKKLQKKSPEEKAEPPQAMNALMRLNQLKPGLQYKLISQTGPVHVPVFTMAVEVDGKNFEASGPSKRTAKLHVAVKVLQDMGLPTGLEQKVAELVKQEEPMTTQETLPTVTQMEPEPAPTTDSPTDEVPKIFTNMYPNSGYGTYGYGGNNNSGYNFYNNGGSNDGPVASGPGSSGPGTNLSSGGAAGAGGFGSYYQSDGSYSSPTGTPKPAGNKPPMHQNTKPQGSGVGQGGSFGQYGQGFGQKKNFGQAQGGGGGGGGNFNYSTAYPSQVTGGQDYSYEGYSNQSNYSSQGGANQNFSSSSASYNTGPAGYGRGDPSMNYQYR
uniref:Interleukin enhancer-binding factor 3 homolog n=1 Tax=Sinocyclocheilus rhinocerous TaxID=307959 RepID=A0A673KNX2_9TELE